MPSTREPPNLLVRPIGDHRRRLWIATEEVLANVGAILRLEVLVLTVDAFIHELMEPARVIPRQEAIPVRAPDDLDDVPSGTAEDALQLLNNLAVATHRSIEPLEVAVHDER